MFSCFFPSECVVHRITPNADLTDYITDTEVYEMPTGVTKPYTSWFTDQNARFSTLALQNSWQITYASTTFEHTQYVLKFRSYEETPVDTLLISPTSFRADYIYTIP